MRLRLKNGRDLNARFLLKIDNSRKLDGFTLVELIVVILLVSILAAVAGPKFFDRTSFQEWGYSDELRGALRYAQKIAMASGCNTQVDLSGGNFSLSQLSGSDCASGTYTRTVPLPGGSGSTFSGTKPAGVSVSVAVTVTPADTSPNLYFDQSGRPLKNGNAIEQFVVTVGSRTITVEPETGYVH